MRRIRIVLLIFGVWSVAEAVFADSIKIIPPKNADLTVVEGTNGSLTYTVTNTGANEVTIASRSFFSEYKSDDPTDVPEFPLGTGGTCKVGLMLAPAGQTGDSCTIVKNFLTSNTPPENGDIGLSSLTVTATTVGGGHDLVTKDFKVKDINFVPTPEPSSLLLLGTGLLGLAPVIRRKLGR